MSDASDYDREMFRRSNLDDAAIERLLAGEPTPGQEALARFVSDAQTASAWPGPEPSRALAALFAKGFLTEEVDLPATAANPVPGPASQARGHHLRRNKMIEAVLAKLAAMGLAAKVGVGAGAVALAGAAAGVGGVLPPAAQDRFPEALAVREAPPGVPPEAPPPGGDAAADGSADQGDASFSLDASRDADGEADQAADGTNTTKGAPAKLLALLAEHCGVTPGANPRGAEYDWSWDASTSPGEADWALDFACEWVDDQGCEVSVDYSREHDYAHPDLSVYRDCPDDLNDETPTAPAGAPARGDYTDDGPGQGYRADDGPGQGYRAEPYRARGDYTDDGPGREGDYDTE